MKLIIDIPEEIKHKIYDYGLSLGPSDKEQLINAIMNGIPLEQEPTGHWIIEDMFDGDVAYRCSECNELFWLESGTPKDNEYNFCPKCGKKLVEPQERSGEE